MSKPWKPETNDSTRRTKPVRKLPEGAVAGLIAVAAACLSAVVLLYKLAGPRDPFAP